MPALWLAQLLCPERHAIFALAYDLEQTEAADIAQRMIDAINTTPGFNPWCGICGSRDLHVEHGKLPTDDWETAIPQLREAEAANMRARDLFGKF